MEHLTIASASSDDCCELVPAGLTNAMSIVAILNNSGDHLIVFRLLQGPYRG